MDVRPPHQRGRILLIGYGNSLRSDDGVGPRVAAAAAGAWEAAGLASIAVHQLTPELADPLASAELAIFVDARLGDEGGGVEVQPLAAGDSAGMSGHASDPRSLLALAQAVYGRCPRAWLVTVPAADFSLSDRITPAGQLGVESALGRIAALIERERQRG
jgi:hydrogenase maturation protease